MHGSVDDARTSPDAKINGKPDAKINGKPALVPLQTEQEMAHILFMDIVGYSKLPVKSQCVVQNVLRQIVQDTQEYQAARKHEEKNEALLICRPSGDGMSMLFFGSPLAPVRCAIQITEALRSHSFMRLRMGIHSGLVQRVPDINAHSDVAGSGIVVAQRVMDQGDAGHILISGESKAAFENLKDYQYPMGHVFLSDLGNCVVKHGHSIRIFSLRDRHYGTPQYGNPIVPKKLRSDNPVTVHAPALSSPPTLLVSITNSLKIAAGGIILILLIRAACQLAVPELYNKGAGAAQAATAAPSTSPEAIRQVDKPSSAPVNVPNFLGKHFGEAQALASQHHLRLFAHDDSGLLVAQPTDLTYDHQSPPANTYTAPDSSVYVCIRRSSRSASAPTSHAQTLPPSGARQDGTSDAVDTDNASEPSGPNISQKDEENAHDYTMPHLSAPSTENTGNKVPLDPKTTSQAAKDSIQEKKALPVPTTSQFSGRAVDQTLHGETRTAAAQGGG